MVVIQTVTPESIFSNSEFTFETTVLSEDIDLKDVTVQIIAPDDIEDSDSDNDGEGVDDMESDKDFMLKNSKKRKKK